MTMFKIFSVFVGGALGQATSITQDQEKADLTPAASIREESSSFLERRSLVTPERVAFYYKSFLGPLLSDGLDDDLDDSVDDTPSIVDDSRLGELPSTMSDSLGELPSTMSDSLGEQPSTMSDSLGEMMPIFPRPSSSNLRSSQDFMDMFPASVAAVTQIGRNAVHNKRPVGRWNQILFFFTSLPEIDHQLLQNYISIQKFNLSMHTWDLFVL
jgi:hypothetical protein